MTDQEIFDHVLNHIREQGPAINEYGGPKYKTDDNRTCAIGCLFEGDKYDISFEGHGIDVLIYPWYDTSKPVFRYLKEAIEQSIDRDIEEVSSLLIELQKAHDVDLVGHGEEAFENKMLKIAGWLGLEYTERT